MFHAPRTKLHLKTTHDSLEQHSTADLISICLQDLSQTGSGWMDAVSQVNPVKKAHMQNR